MPDAVAKRWSSRDLVAASVLAAALAIARDGYSFGGDDHLDMLPLLRAMTEPGTYARDWFVHAAGGMNIRLFYLWLMQALSLPFGLAGAHFIAFFVTVAASFAGLVRLAEHYGCDALSAAGAAAIGLFSSVALGLGHAVWLNGQMLPNLLAYALATWGLLLAVRGDWRAAAGLFGAATLAHAAAGAPAAVIGAVAAAFSGRDTRRPTDGASRRSAALWAAVIYLAVAAPALALVAHGEAAEPGVAAVDEGYVLAEIRAPLHFSPASWPAGAWLSGGVMVGGVLISLRSGGWRRGPYAGPALACLLAMVVGAALLTVCPSAWIVKLHPLRAMVWFRFFFGVAWARRVCRPRDRQPALGIAGILCGFDDARLLAAAPVMLLTARAQRLHVRAIGCLVGLAAAAGAIAWSHPGGLHRLAVEAGVCMAACAALAQEAPERRAGAGGLMRFTAGLTIALAIAVAPLARGAWLPQFASDWLWRECHRSNPAGRATCAPQRVAEWAAGHLPIDAVVLVAPWLEDFRLRSGRAVVVDFKAVPFTRVGLRQWAERLAAICGLDVAQLERGRPPPDFAAAFAQQGGPELATVAQQFGARYLAIECAVDEPWRLIHRDGRVRLYEMTPMGAAQASAAPRGNRP